MCSQINWWNQKRVSWYERASEYTIFHSTLASILTKTLDKKDKIIEAGCGLGYLSNEIASYGYDIKGYDIDSTAIDFAKNHFNPELFENLDIFSSSVTTDVLICVFFGKLSRNNNYDNFKKIAKRKIIYITGGGSARHVPPKEIEEFLLKEGAIFRKKTLTLPFHQPFISLEEGEEFLSSYYKNEIRDEKRNSIVKSNINGYPWMLKNNKEITIFEIQIGGVS